MDEATQHNSAMVEENAATAKMLDHQAMTIDQRVNFFQFDEDAPRTATMAKRSVVAAA